MSEPTLSEVIELADGRRLDVRVSGPVDGTPLIFHHGTPGSVVPARDIERATHERGLRLVTMSRPGYGISSRHRGRRVVDVVADTTDVLRWLGAQRCLTAGWSGGGPHALACAARLDAVAGALVIAGVAPFEAEGLTWLDGMGEENLEEFGVAQRGEGPLRSYLEGFEEQFKVVTPSEIVESLSSVLPDVDRAVITDEFGEDLAIGFHEAVRTGVDGWLDDDLAFVRPWGFELNEIAIPTMIWQGELDLMVPFAHGEWLASRLSSATVHLEPGQGHLSIGVGYLDRMLDELAGAL